MIVGEFPFEVMFASGLHSTLCLMILMERSSISLVTILTIVAVAISRLSSVGLCLFSRLIIKFHEASLKAGWCINAKSRQTPGIMLFAMQAASRLNVPLPDIGSSRQ